MRAYLRQGGNTVKVDGKRWNFRWRLKVDTVSIEQMCAGTEFQVEGADAEKAQEENLLVIPGGLVKRLVLEERKRIWTEDSEKSVQRGTEAERYEVFKW